MRAADVPGADGALGRAVDRGAVVLGVCAGFQLLGRTFPDSRRPARTRPRPPRCRPPRKGTRRAGRWASWWPRPRRRRPDGCPTGAPCPPLTGFENHGGVTAVGPGSTAAGPGGPGRGQRGGDGTEGAWSGRVVGTYLHGPVLARNADLADLLLGWALYGVSGRRLLAPLDDAEERPCRAERLAAVAGRARSAAGCRLEPQPGAGTGRCARRRRADGPAPDSVASRSEPGGSGGASRRRGRPGAVGAAASAHDRRQAGHVGTLQGGGWSRPPPAGGPSTSRWWPRWPGWPRPPRCGAPNRRASSPSAGHSGVPKVTVVRVRCTMPAALGQDVPGAVEVDRDHRPPRARRPGRRHRRRNSWAHPSGERPPSGKMTRFQSSASSSAARSAERAVDLGPLDGDGAEEEREGVGLPPPVEEVVGGRRHHRPVAEPQGQAAPGAAGCRRGWRGWRRR